jgi:adenosylmethionine-8-amino-7-oxononanoate aminotransferase
MATKKQKHAAAVAKRTQFLEEVRQTGLMAQAEDRRRREARQKRAEAEAPKRMTQEEVRKLSEILDAASIEQECI